MNLPKPIHVDDVSRDDLPGLIGALAELSARAIARLHEPVAVTDTPKASRLIDADQAAAIAGTTRRWILTATKGRRFRQDLSRKQPRFAESGLRTWLGGRHGR